MSTVWVLIFVLNYSGKPAIQTIDFKSLDECQTAAKLIKRNMWSVDDTFCLGKR